MKYTGSLVKSEREKIFELFRDCDRLKFNEIEKSLKIRSNMVSYHIEQMQKEGLLEKRAEYYHLTPYAEKYIPIFSHITGKELSPLPVVLVAIMDGNKILLLYRNIRPYKGYWSLIGGKMLLEEDMEESSLRLVKEKTGLDCKFVSMNSIIHERVTSKSVVKHGFLLFFTKVSVPKSFSKGRTIKESSHGELKWFNVKDILKNNIQKNNIIPSDLWLMKNKLDSKAEIKNVIMDETEGKITTFSITKSRIQKPKIRQK